MFVFFFKFSSSYLSPSASCYICNSSQDPLFLLPPGKWHRITYYAVKENLFIKTILLYLYCIVKEPLASTTTAQNKSFPSALKLYYKEDRACGRDPKIMMQDMRIALSLQQLSIKLKGGNQAAIAPPPHRSTAMRLSKEPFREVPLTPSKVRAKQGQRAECKHFKRHFGKTKAILDPRQAERAHVKWDKLYF